MRSVQSRLTPPPAEILTASPSDILPLAQSLAEALAVGLLVGLERGWRERELPDGGRVAGLRTFALIGLLGGLSGMESAPVFAFGVGLAAVALLFAVSYRRASFAAGSLSITTAVAALVTFVLGALAARGQAVLAVAAAVVVALLLDLKAVLHRWLRLIQPAELNAVLQIGVLSAVILPLLPDAGFGPYGGLNPFRLWFAVVLIATLSLAGHAAIRIRGERQGLLWSGLLGGLASSTAATLALARSARAEPRLARPASAGIVAACGVMFVRMAVVILALQPTLAPRLAGLLAFLGVASFAATACLWPRSTTMSTEPAVAPAKVFDLATAIGFAAVLAGVGVLARAAQDVLGVAGVYGVAFLSGLADVDAVVISSVQMFAQERVGATVVSIAILLATLANLLVKGAMAWTIGGRRVGAAVVGGYLAVIAAGAVTVAISQGI